MIDEDVMEKVAFARRRLAELQGLVERREIGADPHLRQQLLQEIVFHLVGAADYAAQLVNERCGVGLHTEDVTVRKVTDKIAPTNPDLATALRGLYANTRGKPLDAPPESDDWYVFR